MGTETIKKLKPLYELGGGVFWGRFPDYPGSDYNYNLLLPFPTAVLRDKTIRAERDEGLRGIFFKNSLYELDLSFDGSLPSSNKKNKRREGMESLDTVIEVGPKLTLHAPRFKLFKSDFILDFNMAIRYGFSTDIKNWKDQGLQFNPYITGKMKEFFGENSLLMVVFSKKWSTDKLMKYYYQVDEQYKTQDRNIYNAKSGLMETSLAAIVHLPLIKNVSFFTGVIQSFYQEAKNRPSPLLPKDQTTSIVVGIYSMFYKSDYLVLD